MADPVFLITGASSGIGAATARAAAQAGYRLVLGARSQQRLQALLPELGGPERVLAQRCDVTQRGDPQALVEQAVSRFGRLDVAFANAGIGSQPGGFSAADPDVWHAMLMTNVYGAALTLQAAIGALRDSRGHLLLTGSAAGRTTIPGSMYSATKWAVTAMGHGVREELRGSGIRVTLIEPGTTDTPFFDTPKPAGLRADDIARAVMYAISQPPHVDVNELLVRPTPAA